MTEEIILKRACDKNSWGFRLTGGRDFGNPLTVSRIHGGSISESGGLKVGDIIIQIGDSIANNLTHNEAQKCIIDCENELKLTVLRGSCPDVQRTFTPIRGILSLNKIDEQISKRDSSHLDEAINAVSVISTSSVYSLYEDDSFDLLEQSDDEYTDEYHEPTEKEIEQMLLENAEVLEENGKSVIGNNFHRIIPKCNFIKDSAVFQVLQEEQVHRELSEREQLAKCPNKRFSTFLAPPDRPIPIPKPKQDLQKDKKKKENFANKEQTEKIDSETQIKDLQICCRSPTIICCQSPSKICCINQTPENITKHENNLEEWNNCENEKTDPNSTLQINNAKESENNNKSSESDMALNSESRKHCANNENHVQIVEIFEEDDVTSSTHDDSIDFDTKLNNIKNTLITLGELPSIIQSQLENIQGQINELMQIKGKSIKCFDKTNTGTVTQHEDDPQPEHGMDNIATHIEDYHDSSSLINEGDNEDNDSQSYTESESNLNEYETEQDEKASLAVTDNPQKAFEDGADDNTMINKEQKIEETEEHQEFRRRRICPLTPLPRPVILPGGRVWRKPQDAYNEEFIAETLISQAEVLVGSTLGVNFRKYEPPKFDLSNSAVYKLIHNIESKQSGLEERETIPSLQDYYQSPISAKHFYRAKLADKVSSTSIGEDQEKEAQQQNYKDNF